MCAFHCFSSPLPSPKACSFSSLFHRTTGFDSPYTILLPNTWTVWLDIKTTIITPQHSFVTCVADFLHNTTKLWIFFANTGITFPWSETLVIMCSHVHKRIAILMETDICHVASCFYCKCMYRLPNKSWRMGFCLSLYKYTNTAIRKHRVNKLPPWEKNYKIFYNFKNSTSGLTGTVDWLWTIIKTASGL